jgi:hypothetical protein
LRPEISFSMVCRMSWKIHYLLAESCRGQRAESLRSRRAD